MSQQDLSRFDAFTAPAARTRLGLALLLCCLALPPAAARQADSGNPPAASRLSQLAMALGDAPEPLRADFAVIAIAQMAEAHRAEAERARLEAAQLSRERDPTRWAGAVDAYAAELLAIASQVTAQSSLAIRIGAANNVYLIIDGTPVIVNGPLAAQQAAFEQQIIERFCGLYLCDELLAGYQAPLSASRPDKSETQWSFSQHAGPACSTADGLEFQFQDMENLRGYREACARIVAELDTLVRGISRSRSSGIRVDWNSLAIQTLPGSERHEVTLNTAGAVILAPLPGLATTPRLFALLRPWIAARVSGKSYRLVVINANRQLAPLLKLGPDGWD
ncbi:MAG: hypothetical protein OEN52_07180 [Gammaproteobacteria bacterium]|nr:hypothetical protein [Gammaproteobacteria bacterium]MDH3560719.1 hypothetical protein [Gammaproteobacteria bacterium]